MISPVSAGGGFTRTGICTIVDMESLEVEVDVNEAYINRVYPGQQATILLNAWPDDPYDAEVIAIIPAANRNQATVRVRIGFLDRDERVMPEMGVRVAFMEDAGAATLPGTESEPPPAGVLVPDSAIVREGGRTLVWIVADNRVSRRQVELGRSVGVQALVVAGLAAGERVVNTKDLDLRERLEDGPGSRNRSLRRGSQSFDHRNTVSEHSRTAAVIQAFHQGKHPSRYSTKSICHREGDFWP